MKLNVGGNNVELSKCPHILVGGSTGSGKSYLMKHMLCEVLDSDEAKVIVVDPKNVDYMFLRGVEGCVYPGDTLQYLMEEPEVREAKYATEGREGNVYSVMEEVYGRRRTSWLLNGLFLLTREDMDGSRSGRVSAVLNDLCRVMDHRYKFMMAHGKVDWGEVPDNLREEYRDMWYGEDSDEDQMSIPYFGNKRIVLVIDELADLLYWDRDKARGGYRGQIERLLIRLSCLGRAAGIHLILGTQRPDANILSGQLRCNIPTRICLSVPNNVERRIILGDSCKDLGERVLLYNGEYSNVGRV